MLVSGPGGWEKFCLSKVVRETLRLLLYFNFLMSIMKKICSVNADQVQRALIPMGKPYNCV